MKISVIGTGYVGLVSGTCFASLGHKVSCIDIDKNKIDKLKSGICPIYEPGLEDLIEKNTREERLLFANDFASIKNSEIAFLAVGTPPTESGEADLSYLFAAAEQAIANANENLILVIKSTVPVGTGDKLKKLVKEKSSKKIFVVNNPEFLKEGAAITDFLKPDRIVIGFEEAFAGEKMDELYAPLVRQGNPIIKMSNLSAELTKYAANCFLATKISFINDIAKLCDLTGADIEEVRKGITSDQRIGKHFLYPGPGYGGSCFPKDVQALIHTAQSYGLNLQVVNAAENVNQEQKHYVFKKLQKHFNNDLKNKKVAIWGVAFKPNTDDVRESPAFTLIQDLIQAGASVQYTDPQAIHNFSQELISKDIRDAQAHDDAYECLIGADAWVLLTEWSEYQNPDFTKILEVLKQKVLVDARNIYPVEKMKQMGFSYYAIGRRT